MRCFAVVSLSTVPRYAPERVSGSSGEAVVVGAGVAGLCAARVLADGFERVTIVDSDSLPDRPTSRRGVPQGDHIHVMLEAARVTLEDLFPGFGEDLLSAGGVMHDAARDVDFYLEGGFLADGPKRRAVYGATRPLYEYVLRQHVAELDRAVFQPNNLVTSYLSDDRASSVNGVVVRTDDGKSREITADLVVDATGRTSRTPNWLDENRHPAPPVDEVYVDVAYSTTYVDRPAGDRRGVTVPPSPSNPRGGAFAPVQDDRWLLTLWGMHGDAPPTDPDGFEEFAASLPVPRLKRLLEKHSWRTETIEHYPFPSNVRRRYEELDRFPERLVVLGDAVASFNPIYGQGMSVAALETVQLHHALAENGRDDIGVHFFDRIADTVDTAWNMAVGSDHQFPQTEGSKPRGTDILNWYLSRLTRRAHTDGELFDSFFRVQTMEKPPTSLLRPGVVWRVFKPGGGS